MAESKYRALLNEIQKIMGKNSTTTSDLNLAGKLLLGAKYKGAWPSDKIPKMRNGDMAIVNLDSRRGAGTHWVGVAKEGGKTIVYDSFGRKSSKIIPSIHKRGGKIFDTERDKEQGVKQKNCGQRCLAALAVFDLYGSGGLLKL